MISSTNKTILVPTDFTEVAGFALQHAIRVATVVKESITLLHIVSESDQLQTMQDKIDIITHENQSKHGVVIKGVVRIGSIFTDIAKTANEQNTSLVIMGSHSIKGKPSINDTHVLKVISQSKVPFITIQEPPVNKRYDDIVFPVDFTSENREKHNWISYFCDYYISTFHLIKPFTDNLELKAKIDLNMASARKWLDEKGAKYNVYTVTGIKPYEQEVLEMAVNIRADLIVIMTTKTGDSQEFLVEPHEQYIIANAGHIPVMSINPL